MCHEHEECQAFVYVKEAFGAAEAKGCHFNWTVPIILKSTPVGDIVNNLEINIEY